MATAANPTADGDVCATLLSHVCMYRCVSFRTPEHVRKEWATEYGLPLFTSDQYTHAMDAVCQRLGVSEGDLRGPFSPASIMETAARP